MTGSNDKPSRQRRSLPRSVVVAAVLGTGVITAWALSATGMTGPQTAWGVGADAVDPVWANPAPAAGMAPPAAGMAASASTMNDPQAAVSVAGIPGIPQIIMGALRPHADRGTCAGCHTILDREGAPVPSIHSSSTMPHGFRGICSNCHTITIAQGLTGSPVAATLMPGPGALPDPAPAAAPMRRQPNEADWRGLEVRPSQRGVVATNVEGTAARAGVQPGDAVVSINGKTVPDMLAFVDATQNGDLRQGTMIVDRNGQRLAFELNPNGDAGMTVPQAPMNPAMTGQTWGMP